MEKPTKIRREALQEAMLLMVVCKIDCSTTKLFSVPLRMIALLYDGIAFPKLMGKEEKK